MLLLEGITHLPPTPYMILYSLFYPVESLREEEMIRSGSREQKKKMLPGGSGSGDLDDVTEALLGLPTILYPDPMTTTTAAAAVATTNAGSSC